MLHWARLRIASSISVTVGASPTSVYEITATMPENRFNSAFCSPFVPMTRGVTAFCIRVLAAISLLVASTTSPSFCLASARSVFSVPTCCRTRLASPLAVLATLSACDATPEAVAARRSACPASQSAVPDLLIASSDFALASLAFSSSDPIILPEIWFVLTKQISSNVSAATRRSVDRFSSRFFLSSIPPVNQSLKLAMYSPAQARVTKPAKMYSANSQRDNDRVSDSTSEAVRVILNHQRRERYVLI